MRPVGTSVTRGPPSPVPRPGLPWILVGAFLVIALLLSPIWLMGLCVFCLGSRSEAVLTSKATESCASGFLATGGPGAGFRRVGEGDGEEAASGETGGLFLACCAAISFGENLRFGGIGVTDFGSLAGSGVVGGVLSLGCGSGMLSSF